MKRLVFLIFIFAGAVFAHGAVEVAVCVINQNLSREENPAYYHLPTLDTKLICQSSHGQQGDSLRALYAENWRLVQIVNIDNRLATPEQTVPNSLIYLDRAAGH